MRRVAILLIALISFGLAMRGAEFDNVNLRYNCEYHLGFVTITADMLSLYYYFSEIDFDRLQPGEKVTIGITLPDGDVQHAEITYNGTDTYNGHNVYATVFEYSYHGEMDNYPVKCLIDSHSRIPLLLSANLKIGHVELVLSP